MWGGDPCGRPRTHKVSGKELRITWLRARLTEESLLLPGSGHCDSLFDPTFSGLGIYPRLVVRVLVLEGVVCVAAQTRVGFGAQYLLQCCYGAGVRWEATQPQ